jgi:hypothetical protein
MSIPTEAAMGWASACDFRDLPSIATAIRSLAAERDALRAALRDIARQPEGDEESAQAVARAALGEKE